MAERERSSSRDPRRDAPDDPFDPAQLDLTELVRNVIQDLGGHSSEGYVVGRTRVRDAVAARVGCSQLRSEQLVDTLVAGRFLRFADDPTGSGPGYWVLNARPDRT